MIMSNKVEYQVLIDVKVDADRWAAAMHIDPSIAPADIQGYLLDALSKRQPLINFARGTVTVESDRVI
jgi:hypothetical protein